MPEVNGQLKPAHIEGYMYFILKRADNVANHDATV
jgi:hypothetical protein